MLMHRMRVGVGIGAVLAVCSGWAQDTSVEMYLDTYVVIWQICDGLVLEPDQTDKVVAYGILADGSIRSDPSITTFLNEAAGVTFPKGSYVYFQEPIHKLFMHNTAENHALTKEYLNELFLPKQIEIDFMVLGMPLDSAEEYARKHGAAVPGSQVLEWFREGQGRLVSSAKVVTRNGVNAQVESVQEITYVSEFDSITPESEKTDALSQAGMVYPLSFETREAGTILNVTPTFQKHGSTIELTLAPEYCTLDGFNEQSIEIPSGDDESGEVSWTMPRFHSVNITTSANFVDGETRVLGGALSVDDEDEMLYLAVTTRLIRPEPPAD